MKIEKVKISEIQPNPDNPRVIKNDKFHKLMNSIEKFPQMLEIRPIVVNEDMMILGGNMRLAACKELGFKEIHIVKADDLTPEQQREFIIKDNVSFGEWDWDALGNEWEAAELNEWGIDSMEDFSTYFTEEEETDGDDKPEKPAATGDDYSVFELVMLHANKLKLLETIARVKDQHSFEKTEDALMEIIRKFNKI